MKNSPLSMVATFSTIYPPFALMEEKPATQQDIALLTMRIMMVNQLLVGCLEMMEGNPHFWSEIDLEDFKKYLTQNKALIFDTQSYFSEGSKTMAVLDTMKSNIKKIEEAMARATAFNFDLARMKERVEGEFVRLPNFGSAKELEKWLCQTA